MKSFICSISILSINFDYAYNKVCNPFYALAKKLDNIFAENVSFLHILTLFLNKTLKS